MARPKDKRENDQLFFLKKKVSEQERQIKRLQEAVRHYQELNNKARGIDKTPYTPHSKEELEADAINLLYATWTYASGPVESFKFSVMRAWNSIVTRTDLRERVYNHIKSKHGDDYYLIK